MEATTLIFLFVNKIFKAHEMLKRHNLYYFGTELKTVFLCQRTQ